ncbi:MAG: hypothetical protein IKG46_02895 [Solobacterium sp.]|nr:hypothetical protein [Solobacterium sp.]
MRRLLKLFFVFTLLFSLAGCGAGRPNLTGEYEITKLSAGDRDMSEELELIKSMGMNITLVLNKDGTGTLEIAGQTIPLTYDADKMIMHLEPGGDEPFTYKKGVISFSENDNTMEFERKKEQKKTE